MNAFSTDETVEREHFFGEWSEETASAAEFDYRIKNSGLFDRTYSEVRGYYMAHRPNRQEKDARLDRVLLPGPRLREAGWTSAIGVELKASGVKLGPPLSQAIDYTYCIFWVGPYPMPIPHIFLWPLRKQIGAVQSVMAQNCIGCVFGDSGSPLVFMLERRVIEIFDDGRLDVFPTASGTKKGSR